MSSRSRCLIIILNVVAAAVVSASVAQAKTVEVLSPVYEIKTKYRSMKGPQSTQAFSFPEKPGELVWVTGYRAVMVGEDGQTVMPQEFMCHSNLDYDFGRHRELFGWTKKTSVRLFTLSQGQFDIQFPKGFGVPMLADEKFSLTTQVLNLNLENPDVKVRHRVNIDYERDEDLREPMKPLFMLAAMGMVLVKGDSPYYNLPEADAAKHGSGCLIGTSASSSSYKDSSGRVFTGHWVVKPGREVNHTLATHYMNLPFDTTVHYIAVHLHPFAESIELKDLTTKKTVFKSHVKAPRAKIGIESVDYFSSDKGIPLYKDHEYEVTSTYNNTTKVEQDSMAVMFLYLLDKEFKKPQRSPAVTAG